MSKTVEQLKPGELLGYFVGKVKYHCMFMRFVDYRHYYHIFWLSYLGTVETAYFTKHENMFSDKHQDKTSNSAGFFLWNN